MRLSTSTQIFLAYSGSSACSASMNAAVHQAFWTSAMACKVSVVLPEDSGQYISTILHLAYHHPSASSREMLHDETVSTFIDCLSQSFITDQAPNCFSIIDRADLSASFLLSIAKLLAINKVLVQLSIYKVYIRVYKIANIF